MRSACTHHLSAPQVNYKKQTCQSNKQGAKPLKMKRRHHQKKEHTVFILCGTYLNCMYNIGRTKKKSNFFTSYSAYHSVQRSRKKCVTILVSNFLLWWLRFYRNEFMLSYEALSLRSCQKGPQKFLFRISKYNNN